MSNFLAWFLTGQQEANSNQGHSSSTEPGYVAAQLEAQRQRDEQYREQLKQSNT